MVLSAGDTCEARVVRELQVALQVADAAADAALKAVAALAGQPHAVCTIRLRCKAYTSTSSCRLVATHADAACTQQRGCQALALFLTLLGLPCACPSKASSHPLL